MNSSVLIVRTGAIIVAVGLGTGILRLENETRCAPAPVAS